MPVKSGGNVERGKYYCTKCGAFQMIHKSGDVLSKCGALVGDRYCNNDTFYGSTETSN